MIGQWLNESLRKMDLVLGNLYKGADSTQIYTRALKTEIYINLMAVWTQGFQS